MRDDVRRYWNGAPRSEEGALLTLSASYYRDLLNDRCMVRLTLFRLLLDCSADPAWILFNYFVDPCTRDENGKWRHVIFLCNLLMDI